MKRTTLKITVACLCTIFFLVLPFVVSSAPANEISEQDSHAIGMEAYIYLYPLVTMDVTHRIQTNFNLDDQPGMGPTNTLAH